MDINDVTERIIGGAITVHRELGPGLLESTYQTCLEYELRRAGLRLERQKSIPFSFRDITIDCGYRIDLLVESSVVVELKSVDRLDAVHHAQLLTYLKLSGCQVGLLINFNVPLLKQGLHRLVLNYQDSPRRPQRPQR